MEFNGKIKFGGVDSEEFKGCGRIYMRKIITQTMIFDLLRS
jgi:hypothetical protein